MNVSPAWWSPSPCKHSRLRSEDLSISSAQPVWYPRYDLEEIREAHDVVWTFLRDQLLSLEPDVRTLMIYSPPILIKPPLVTEGATATLSDARALCSWSGYQSPYPET
jgi:hypothetical protein